MTTEHGNNGWREYQRLVLAELKRLDETVEKLTVKIDKTVGHERNNRRAAENATMDEVRRIALEVHGLKIKAGIWGLLGGLLPVLTALLMKQL